MSQKNTRLNINVNKKNMRISNKKKNDANNLNNKEVDEVWTFFYLVDTMDMTEGMETNVKKRLE